MACKSCNNLSGRCIRVYHTLDSDRRRLIFSPMNINSGFRDFRKFKYRRGEVKYHSILTTPTPITKEFKLEVNTRVELSLRFFDDRTRVFVSSDYGSVVVYKKESFNFKNIEGLKQFAMGILLHEGRKSSEEDKVYYRKLYRWIKSGMES